MNTNNSSQQALPPPTSAIQIEIPTPVNVNTNAAESDSFGALRGRLIDGIRRVMLPTTTGGLASNVSSYNVFRSELENPSQSPQVDSSQPPIHRVSILEHHRTPPGTLPLNTHQDQPGSTPQSPINETEAARLQGVDIPDVQPQNVPGSGATDGGAADDNQRNVETLTDAMAQHPELRAFVVAVLKTLPFVGIIVLKLSYDHLNSLMDLACMGGIFWQTNLFLKKEIAKTQQKNIKKLTLLLLVICLSQVTKWAHDQFVFDILTMMSYRTVHTFPELLYYMLIADLSVKCLTVAVKTVITMSINRSMEYNKRVRIAQRLNSSPLLIPFQFNHCRVVFIYLLRQYHNSTGASCQCSHGRPIC